MKKFFKKFSLSERVLQKIFFVVFGLLIGINAVTMVPALKRIQGFKENVPEQMIGVRYMGLKPFVKDVEFVGYYTDSNILEDENQVALAQAQYVLAPSVLEYNNLDHDYILFVCENEKTAWKMMTSLKATPIARNEEYGMVLSQRNKWK